MYFSITSITSITSIISIALFIPTIIGLVLKKEWAKITGYSCLSFVILTIILWILSKIYPKHPKYPPYPYYYDDQYDYYRKASQQYIRNILKGRVCDAYGPPQNFRLCKNDLYS